jgi:hypothetical protein
VNIIEVPNIGHWACAAIECEACGLRTTHVWRIGTLEELICFCGVGVPLEWETLEKPADEPVMN